MRGARKAAAPRDSLNFRRASLLSRNEFESGTFTIVLHATSSFTYVSVIYGANFPFNCLISCIVLNEKGEGTLFFNEVHGYRNVILSLESIFSNGLSGPSEKLQCRCMCK